MPARYFSAATSGAFMTLALLFVMQLLISLQPGAQSEPRNRTNLDIFRAKIPDTPIQHEDEIIPKEKLTHTEKHPPRLPYSGGNEAIFVPREGVAPPSGSGLPPIGAFTDGPLVVLVRVAPIYPARAIARGIEGYVVVRFDVTPNGQVTNIVLIESTDSVFESAAIKAAERFKFKPRIIDGEALASYGIQNMFRFSLDDQ